MRTYPEIIEIANSFIESIDTNWIVISGPPSSGKTTLINALDHLGYKTNGDISRLIIENHLKEGNNISQIRENDETLQKEILLAMVNKAEELSIKELIFHDYSFPDNIPYLKINNLNIPHEFIFYSKYYKFRNIYICEPLSFVRDGIRTESLSEQKELYNLIWENYLSLGYNPILLPRLSLNERINLIINNLK